MEKCSQNLIVNFILWKTKKVFCNLKHSMYTLCLNLQVPSWIEHNSTGNMQVMILLCTSLFTQSWHIVAA